MPMPMPMLTTKLIFAHLDLLSCRQYCWNVVRCRSLGNRRRIKWKFRIWAAKQIINNVLSDENRNLFAEVWYGWLVRFRQVCARRVQNGRPNGKHSLISTYIRCTLCWLSTLHYHFSSPISPHPSLSLSACWIECLLQVALDCDLWFNVCPMVSPLHSLAAIQCNEHFVANISFGTTYIFILFYNFFPAFRWAHQKL